MKRSAGILMHITSLPGQYGIGDFGYEAYKFVDFLKKSGQIYWEVLPLTLPDQAGSPYASTSSLAGNWFLISPDLLVKDNLLDKKDLPKHRPVDKVYYHKIKKERRKISSNSFKYFNQYASGAQKKRFKKFRQQESAWLKDYALFMAIKDHWQGQPWWQWSKPLANRNKAVIKTWQKKLSNQIKLYEYRQWLFFDQWLKLKKYANQKGIKIFGDLPFFVMHDSVDVWANKNLFLLKNNKPTSIAGAPPDMFSSRGQIWGNPHFNWQAIKKTNFHWWIKRLQMSLRLFDLIRLDHFRGYQALWHIPFNSKTARLGQWKPVPGEKLFKIAKTKLRRLPLVAEDLGTITMTVVNFRNQLNLPGMRVLQFAFNGDPKNFHLPENYIKNCVAYTGTHDNDTSRGWITKSGKIKERRNALKYVKASQKNYAGKLIQAGLRSKADVFIAPLQDYLNLGYKARMNKPSTTKNNWRWRAKKNAITILLAKHIYKLTKSARR